MQNTRNIHRVVKVLAKETDSISVSHLHLPHTSLLFPRLCLGDLRCCLKKRARKKKAITGKMYGIFKTTSGFTSVFQYCSHSGYLESLVCFEREALWRHLSSETVQAKQSTKSRALSFESSLSIMILTHLKTPFTSSEHTIHLICLSLDSVTLRDTQLIRCCIYIIPRGTADMWSV